MPRSRGPKAVSVDRAARCTRPKPAETRDDFESTPRDIKISKNNYLRWRRRQSRANPSPNPVSLFPRENTGKIVILAPLERESHASTPAIPRLPEANSLRRPTGNFQARTGKTFATSGNVFSRSRNVPKVRIEARSGSPGSPVAG